jgi:hypothetical protein
LSFFQFMIIKIITQHRVYKVCMPLQFQSSVLSSFLRIFLCDVNKHKTLPHAHTHIYIYIYTHSKTNVRNKGGSSKEKKLFFHCKKDHVHFFRFLNIMFIVELKVDDDEGSMNPFLHLIPLIHLKHIFIYKTLVKLLFFLSLSLYLI